MVRDSFGGNYSVADNVFQLPNPRSAAKGVARRAKPRMRRSGNLLLSAVHYVFTEELRVILPETES